MRDRFTFLIFLACVGLASFFGAQFVPGAWYEALQKPPLNPPNWIFAPVWSALYLAVAVAGWLVWRSGPTSRLPLALWGSQLALNAAWSWLFFGLERPGLAGCWRQACETVGGRVPLRRGCGTAAAGNATAACGGRAVAA